MRCYNIAKLREDDDDPRNKQIPEIQLERLIIEMELQLAKYAQHIKNKKVNIGIKESPKMVITRYYQDDEKVDKVAYILHEYQDLFPNTFEEMKGIVRELGKMTIPLKPGAATLLVEFDLQGHGQLGVGQNQKGKNH